MISARAFRRRDYCSGLSDEDRVVSAVIVNQEAVHGGGLRGDKKADHASSDSTPSARDIS